MAKNYSCIYINKKQLRDFILEHKIENSPNVFVQVFFGKSDLKKIKNLQAAMSETLPKAKLIGCTSEGEIVNGRVLEEYVILSFTIFERTKVKTMIINNKTGKELTAAEKLVRKSMALPNLKALISFATDEFTNMNGILEDLAMKKNAVLTGGYSKRTAERKSYVFTMDEVSINGIVLAGLYSEHLEVQSYSNMNWQKIGEPFIVSASNGNLISSVNNENPLKLLIKHLSPSMIQMLQESSFLFPLYVSKDGVDSVVYISKMLDTGEIEISGQLAPGDQFHFAYANIEQFILNSESGISNFAENKIEVIFTYYSAIRNYLYKSFSNDELRKLQFIAPTNGLLLSGEISADKENKPASHSAVSVIGLSETAPAGNIEHKINTYSLTDEISSHIYLSNIIDYSLKQAREYSDEIARIINFDKETGLPNRKRILEMVEEQIKLSDKNRNTIAILFIDIDRFKIINDSLGHLTGDKVLKEISNRIRSVIPEDVILGRFGGDKFTLILTNNVEYQYINVLSKQLLELISMPIFYENNEFFLSASIGVSFYPNDGSDADIIMKNADMAMNRAKQQGGNKITFFSNEMNEQIMYRFELERYLRRAIEKEELFLCYQPLIDLKTGMIIGCEALVRWNHPKLGLIPPLEFIPIAEETGLIQDIGNWVLNEACKQNQKWISQGVGDIFISVNVSAQQFQHPSFVFNVKNALSQSGLEAKHLHLELTESGMLMNINHSIQIMKAVKNLGVQISIDDFGTGYSSLSYLKDLPISSLKIDRSFIHNLHLELVDRSIVKAIITMGNGLSVKVVAEGVETLEQIQELKNMNCDYAQGYYFEKPVDEMAFEQLLISRNQAFERI